jgi:hypothetical protein
VAEALGVRDHRDLEDLPGTTFSGCDKESRMSQQLGSYINFGGKAREAAGRALIIATDGRPEYPAKVGDHMAIALAGTDRVRLSKIFNDLADGGKIKGPLTKQSGGGEVGWLVDKFGMNWMVSTDKA